MTSALPAGLHPRDALPSPFVPQPRGALDEGTFHARADFALRILANPGLESWWIIGRRSFGPDFLEWIDERLADQRSQLAGTTEDMSFYDPKNWPRKERS